MCELSTRLHLSCRRAPPLLAPCAGQSPACAATRAQQAPCTAGQPRQWAPGAAGPAASRPRRRHPTRHPPGTPAAARSHRLSTRISANLDLLNLITMHQSAALGPWTGPGAHDSAPKCHVHTGKQLACRPDCARRWGQVRPRRSAAWQAAARRACPAPPCPPPLPSGSSSQHARVEFRHRYQDVLPAAVSP